MDRARKWTDKQLAQMEKKISKIYDQAYKDLSKEWNQFMAVHEPMVQEAYDKYMDARKNGTTQEIFDARTYYERVFNNTVIQDKRYKAMTDELAAKMSNVNEIALDYLNGNMPKIYTVNYNAFGSEKIKGYSFALTNENAVKELMTTDKLLVPTKQLNKVKDKKWNAKFINSQVTQGILQGESMDKIAKRIFPEIQKKDESGLVKRNKQAAIRNARTMTTAAENKGRQDSYEKAQDDGVIMVREWIATHDERTRDWHRELDGIETEVNQAWSNGIGDIMFPGDPSADPANVYNCRCAMRVKVKGFNWNKSETKVIEKEEPKQEEIKVGRNYDCDFAKYYGEDFYNELCDLVDDCGNDDLKILWNQYQSQITAKDPKFTGRAHASAGSIHVNKNDAKGSSWQAPYAVTVHESGHAIDFLSKNLADGEGLKLMFSSAYNNGEFPATIRQEVMDLVNAKDKELKALFKEHKTDYEFLHNHGLIDDWSYKFYRDYGKWPGREPKYSKSIAYKVIEKEVKSISGGGMTIGDLSDMLEGATDAKIRCGYGHGKSYWKKLFGIDESLGTEAFAEMTSATVTNKESLAVIKQYLPKSYQVYENMLKDLASKGVI